MLLFRVKLRRGATWKVRPNAEQIDGKTYNFDHGWEITPVESECYAGETAYIPHDLTYPSSAPAWIASGDLVFVN